MIARVRVERRPESRHGAVRAAIGVAAVVCGLLAGAIVLLASGQNVGSAYRAMWYASFGTGAGWEQTTVKAVPLILTGLAVAVALRMELWNIGGEGQFAAGATAATAIALNLSGLPGPLLLLLMALGAVAAGAAWAAVAAIPRALLGVSEIISTLFLNYIMLLGMSELVAGPWRDPGSVGADYSLAIPAGAELPRLGASSVSVGIFVALGVIAAAWWLVEHTRWGFGIRVAGGSREAARYLGLPLRRRTVAVLCLSGGIAAVGGLIQLAGVQWRLTGEITQGYGYSGILVAFLAAGSLVALVPIAFLFAGLLTGGFALQSTGVQSSVATVIQAAIIIFAIAGEATSRYRVRVASRAPGAPPLVEAPARLGETS